MFELALPWLAFVGLLTGLIWWAYRTPPEVSLKRDLSPASFQGRTLPLTVHLQLKSRLPVRVVVEDPPPLTVIPDVSPAFEIAFLGELKLQTTATLTLNKRGIYRWSGTKLRWADPLGLFWRSRFLETPTQLEVYPGIHGLLLPDLLRPLLSEGTLSRTLGLEDPISLRSVREYVTGDPPGRIHWRLSARTGMLTVREPERTAASSLTVYLDTSHGSEVFVESAVRLAASLVQEASKLNLPISVATHTGATPAGRTPEAFQAAMRALAQVEAEPGQIELGQPNIPPTRAGGNLIILTLLAGDALVQQAMRARATASRVTIVVMPEGFYLEPGENPRKMWVAIPDSVRELERQAGALAEAGILVFVLRGNQSVLRLGA